MSEKTPQPAEAFDLEKRAKTFDRWVTAAIIVTLLIPVPFVRFEAWPGGAVLFERLVTPWSRFRICYVNYPENEPVEENYEFTWQGRLVPGNSPLRSLHFSTSLEPPLLKWQEMPEMALSDAFRSGDFLRIKTSWRPLLFWPFSMAAGLKSNR